MLIELTDSNFKREVLNYKGDTIVDFYTTSCVPCKKVEKSLVKLKAEVDGQVKIGRVDVEKSPALVARYGVRSLPTLLFFKGGKPQEQITGALSLRKIKERLKI